MQGRKNYQEKLFTSFQLSDRVPQENFYRRLNKCLDLNFLYKETEKYYGKEGQPSIDPVVFFKLLLTGYFENLQSDRRIIENARLRLDILYFIGYDIDEELPWHSTLSRTRQLLGEDVFTRLFQHVLKLCIERGMVAGRRQAIDSFFAKANASMESLVDKDILEDGSEYISTLDEAAQEEGLIKKIPSKKSKLSNKTHTSTTDPDARLSMKKGKKLNLNYLGQVSVDTSHHVITNIEAHHADKRDSECLEGILDHTIENLGSEMPIEEILADTNYSSASALQSAKDRNITPYIPNIGGYHEVKEGFIYHQEGDYYECRNGAKLVFKNVRLSHNTSYSKNYAASTQDCSKCPFRKGCISDKAHYKRISQTIGKEFFEEMQLRIKTRYGRYLKKVRSSTVEPVIGTLMNFMTLKKIQTKGITQANKTMVLAGVAYNLKKWLNWNDKKSKVIAQKLLLLIDKPILQTCFQHLFNRIQFQLQLIK